MIGTIWQIQLTETESLPALVVADPGTGLITVCVIRSKTFGSPLEVPLSPSETGPAWVECSCLHAVYPKRLVEKLGEVRPETMVEVRDRLRLILGLKKAV